MLHRKFNYMKLFEYSGSISSKSKTGHIMANTRENAIAYLRSIDMKIAWIKEAADPLDNRIMNLKKMVGDTSLIIVKTSLNWSRIALLLTIAAAVIFMVIYVW